MSLERFGPSRRPEDLRWLERLTTWVAVGLVLAAIVLGLVYYLGVR